MPLELRLAAAGPALAAVLTALSACAVPAPAPATVAAVAPPAPPPPPVVVIAPAPPAPAAPPSPHAVEPVLAYAERLRSLPPAEQAQEVQRLGDGAYSPQRALQFAAAVTQSRNPAQTARAIALVQRVLAQQDEEAQPLHPLARLLQGQLAEQKRAEDAAERQALQLREAQRRIDQLNDRLEAVRAIERSVPVAPRREGEGASAPRSPASRPPAP